MLSALIFILIFNSTGIQSYWQQDVSYTIDVRLDTLNHFLRGVEELTYINNSPESLSELYIHLYPNAYKNRKSMFAKEMERMGKYRFAFSKENERGWLRIDSLFIEGKESSKDASILKDKITEMKIKLPKVLEPEDSVKITFFFCVKIPHIFSRLGHRKTHYEITQWYPKMVVYDKYGWHPDGYHTIGEFYGEFGRFDVNLTVPENMVVGATGMLIDSTQVDSAEKKLHFLARNVHDFAFVCDPKYKVKKKIFKGTTIKIIYFKRDEDKWSKALDYAKDALYYYGKWYGKYPYKTLTVAQGFLGTGRGMEYPNLVIISSRPNKYTNFFETTVIHEVGHQWFYGMLGSNEMDEAWLDEGINSFSEMRYMEEKYGENEKLLRLPKFLSFISPLNDRYYHYFLYYLSAQYEKNPILTPAYDFIRDPVSYAGIEYSKPALVMDMLRNYVGDEKFNEIMKTYVKRFRFKHPYTEDFITIVNKVAGEDMNWFFAQWLKGIGKCDYEIEGLNEVDIFWYGKGYPNTTKIKIKRNGTIKMPFTLLANEENGNQKTLSFSGAFKDTSVILHTKSRIKETIIDPNKKILETNRWNNNYPRKITIKPMFDFPDFEAYQLFYYPYFWYQRIDGVQLGGGLQGREFIPIEKFHGKNAWDYHFLYGTGSKKFFHNATLSFPILKRYVLRLEFALDPSEEKEKIMFQCSSFNGILIPPEHSFNITLERDWLKSNRYKMVKYWEPAKLLLAEALYTFRKKRMLINHCFLFKFLYGAGDFEFYRFSIRLNEFLKTSRRNGFTVKIFAGFLSGKPPKQFRFYPSGSLFPTRECPFAITYSGSFSPLEYYHIEGGPDLKGYYGKEISGGKVLSINLFSPNFSRKTPVSSKFFWDAGSIFDKNSSAKVLMDVGLRLSVGPIFFDFPFWINFPDINEQPFSFRCSLGISAPTLSFF